jgi:hypothetical protein
MSYGFEKFLIRCFNKEFGSLKLRIFKNNWAFVFYTVQITSHDHEFVFNHPLR